MLEEKLALVPTNPGCYLMKDKNSTIIYVGKAKNLKKRLTSYFRGQNTPKTEALVNNIYTFDYIITTTEKESLILEINLIKKHNPKYNILLKDDKTYPYIELTNEEFPILQITRQPNHKNYIFGPYPNAYAAREVVNLLNRTYPIRKCKKMPKKECLYYHIGECLAPCINNIKEEDQKFLKDVKRFLRGNYDNIKKDLTNKMQEHSERLEYELAKECKELLIFIEATLEKQKIVMNDNKDIDVFGYKYKNGELSISILFIRNGVILSTQNKILETIDDDTDELIEFIIKYYETAPIPNQILIPSELKENFDENIFDIKTIFPQKGEKKKLIQMAKENAKELLEEQNKLKLSNKEKTFNANKKIGEHLNIKYPKRIEAFDNSHLFGDNAVSSMVVFIDGTPNRKEYRKYKIKFSKGNDDYASLKEVIARRYSRVLNEDLERPDLILVDGGKGQISAAKEILKELNLNIPIAGLKKNNKHNLDYLIDQNNNEIKINKSTPEFKLLVKIDEEAHRFAIDFHKNLRSKKSILSELDQIDGIGPKRKKALIKKFGSLKQIKEASIDQLKKIIPEEVAKNLKEKTNERNRSINRF